MIGLWLMISCTASEPTPTAPIVKEEPVMPPPARPAEWSPTLKVGAAVASYWTDQTLRQKPPKTRFTIDDPVSDRIRSLKILTQRELPMVVDDDTAHWHVETEDVDTRELVILDFTIDWAPPPPNVELPGHSYKIVAVEIQAVGGTDRYTMVQHGERWERKELP